MTYTHYYVYMIDGPQGPAYRTGNSTQCSVTTYMGKESEKNGYVYMDKWITLLPEPNTTLCKKSTVVQYKIKIKQKNKKDSLGKDGQSHSR